MVLFINGWATNQTIWSKLNLRQNSNFYDVSLHKSFSDLEHQLYHLYKKSSHPLTLIGWSLGGMFALELAHQHPRKIKKLILISSTAKFVQDETYPCGLNEIIVKNLSRKIHRNSIAAQKEFYKLMFSIEEQSFQQEFIQKQSPAMLVSNIDNLQENLQYLLQKDLRNILKEIKIPTQIIHGTSDKICPVDAGKYLYEHLFNAELTLLPTCGHIPFLTQQKACEKIFFSQGKEDV